MSARGSWTWWAVGARGSPPVLLSPMDVRLLLFPLLECRQERGWASSPDSCPCALTRPHPAQQVHTERESTASHSPQVNKMSTGGPVLFLLSCSSGICLLVPCGTHWATAAFSLPSLSRSSPQCSWHTPVVGTHTHETLRCKAHSCCWAQTSHIHQLVWAKVWSVGTYIFGAESTDTKKAVRNQI